MTKNKAPRVCIVRHDYYPDGHVSRDAETLAVAGYDVSVIALRRPGQCAREFLNGVTVYRLPVQHRRGSMVHYVWEYLCFFVLAFTAVTLLHLHSRFRVVEVDNLPDVLAFTALVPKLTGARVIFYMFDFTPELLVDVRGFTWGHPIVRVAIALEQLSARLADRVIVPHEMVRRRVEARGISRTKLITVLNCPDDKIFAQSSLPRPSRTSHSLEIVTHGTILERFGIQVLIDALPELRRRFPEVRAHVFGDGEYRHQLELQAARLGVAECIEFHGFVPQRELVIPLQQAHIGYVGMLCDLMLSNKLMDYVALGVPAVVARWPTYEHYFPEDAVTYFQAGNVESLVTAICRVHTDPGGTQAKTERACELYQVYHWGVQREVYLGTYARLLNGTSSQSSRVEVVHESAAR